MSVGRTGEKQMGKEERMSADCRPERRVTIGAWGGKILDDAGSSPKWKLDDRAVAQKEETFPVGHESVRVDNAASSRAPLLLQWNESPEVPSIVRAPESPRGRGPDGVPVPEVDANIQNLGHSPVGDDPPAFSCVGRAMDTIAGGDIETPSPLRVVGIHGEGFEIRYSQVAPGLSIVSASEEAA